jgi:hypothetical protein
LNAAARRWKGSLVLDHDLCWPVKAACIAWQPGFDSPPIGRVTGVGSLTPALQTTTGGMLPWEPWVKTDIDGKSCGFFPGVGLFLVGPYADAASERGRVADWCLRGLGATFYHELVALVVPHDAEISRYKALLETKGEPRSKCLMILRERKPKTSIARGA